MTEDEVREIARDEIAKWDQEVAGDLHSLRSAPVVVPDLDEWMREIDRHEAIAYSPPPFDWGIVGWLLACAAFVALAIVGAVTVVGWIV